jgi:hypothetical protein
MSKWKDFSTGFALISISAGISASVMCGILPKSWIESLLHADPDGGSGIAELLFAIFLVAIGAAITLCACRRSSVQRGSEHLKPCEWYPSEPRESPAPAASRRA